jgi:glycosyltransferase involved in cell wall biosynthesis
MDKIGWLVNDQLTGIPGTTTFWHNLLYWFPNLIDKTGGYTDYSILANIIEHNLESSKPPRYILRNGSYFRKINTDIKTITLIQDILIDNIQQIETINSSDIIVFNTNYVFEKYKRHVDDITKIRICPLGIDFNFFKPIDVRHDSVLPNSILFIGSSLNYPKGFNVMLDIIQQMEDINFCLVMKDNYSIHNLPESVRHRVIIFNKITQDILLKIINSCICTICTSYEETQHLSGIECGACNIPIVARLVGVYYDSKDDNEWGVIADDTNFVQKLYYVLNNKHIFNPREYFIKKYSNEVCKENWINIINEI